MRGQKPGHPAQDGLARGLLQAPGGSRGSWGFTPLLLGRLVRFLQEDATAALVLHLQESLGASRFSAHSGPRPPGAGIEAQREVGVGGGRMRATRRLTAFHLGGTILMNLVVRGGSATRN